MKERWFVFKLSPFGYWVAANDIDLGATAVGFRDWRSAFDYAFKQARG